MAPFFVGYEKEERFMGLWVIHDILLLRMVSAQFYIHSLNAFQRTNHKDSYHYGI